MTSILVETSMNVVNTSRNLKRQRIIITIKFLFNFLMSYNPIKKHDRETLLPSSREIQDTMLLFHIEMTFKLLKWMPVPMHIRLYVDGAKNSDSLSFCWWSGEVVSEVLVLSQCVNCGLHSFKKLRFYVFLN